MREVAKNSLECMAMNEGDGWLITFKFGKWVEVEVTDQEGSVTYFSREFL